LLRIGVLHDDKEQYEESLVNYQEAANIISKNYGTDLPDLGDIYRYIGKSYRLARQSENAITYLNKALEIYVNAFGEVNTSVAEIYLNLEITHRLDEQYDSALYYVQRAIASNSIDYQAENIEQNPKITAINNKLIMTGILLDKSLIFYRKGKEEHLKMGLTTVQSADTLINEMNKEIVSFADKLTLAQTARDIYGVGISIAKALYEKNGDAATKNQAFYYVEKIRSVVLNDALLNRAA